MFRGGGACDSWRLRSSTSGRAVGTERRGFTARVSF